MRFRHLDHRPDAPVAELGAAGLDALLERGDLEAWRDLARAVAADPWGPAADTVLRICEAHAMYGTTALWRAWIARRRGAQSEKGETLAQARARVGLTQSEMARLLGISQSDVSKLERRGDLRLSTLLRYARALGARLEITLQAEGDAAPRPLELPGVGEQ
jgi:DNA-binding XRE family transcriptional regulator